jgi:hypothetical protein
MGDSTASWRRQAWCIQQAGGGKEAEIWKEKEEVYEGEDKHYLSF